MRIATPEALQQAADWLARHDPVLTPVIARAGLCTIRPHRDYYRALAGSIISQQLSVKAADAIERRFMDLFGGTFPAPAAILHKTVDELRAAGLSRAKAAYIRDLADHIQSGRLLFDRLDDMDNSEIVAYLTDVKGIGEWTAHMFLMFCMGRLDVLPVGDLGIRNGVRQLYGLADIPTPQQVATIAQSNHWHPYESIASWYIWQALDNAPE